MQSLEAAVHDAGVGFIMIGGEHSYGPGGYRGSPVEDLLPSRWSSPQRRVIPNGALCLILHTCEIAEGNYWAKQIGKAGAQRAGPPRLHGRGPLRQRDRRLGDPRCSSCQDRAKLHAMIDRLPALGHAQLRARLLRRPTRA
jgi:hypothetical protein